ncbi:putative late blight resistance protein homolog R1A-10 isoform X1 [Nicotiana tabacum]|uniref:Late blight resistance protein homolog R1A-10 isoform X1 n=2 Tax=Nicotiana tabacum TaxID=4097 RepID=A0A1S4DI74_TOBAC|nr:PREDICTED: putative late blight resistance protein homolog R1A-10 isoform X1 [Nicotiana tabacum]
MKDLLKKVKDVAHKVEDEVESHIQREAQKKLLKMLQRVFHLPTKAHERLLKILQRAIKDIDSVNKELMKLRENNMRPGNCSLGASTSSQSHASTLENEMVGYNIEQELILGQLRGHSSQLEVISIFGMGGIGKSTFAKRIFSDPSIVSFFDVRGWIVVSKDYNIRKMLLSLLKDVGMNEEADSKSDGELSNCLQKSDGELEDGLQKIDDALADRLQKSLKGRRYLIVVDDIWSTEAWDEIKLWFPDNSNRSRILLTTRDMNVAQYASFPNDPFPMRLLKPKESWHLFCQKAFGKKGCPTEVENVARVIVENCQGLPLIISVVAGTLSSKKTLDTWREVAQNVSSLVNLDDYERCSGVLASSYSYLPSHLKACFLYFGAFPKANEISVKKLIRLWVAEGLLELKGLKELEKLGSSLLHDLIDKSLVVVSKRSLDGKTKTCRIHDLLHDLCLREAEKENLLYVVNPPISKGHRTVFPKGRRWLSLHSMRGFSSSFRFDNLTHSKTRSLHISITISIDYLALRLNHFKLLRVLDLEKVGFDHLPREIVHLVSLRYLAMIIRTIPKDLPISKLWNLQTFVFPQYFPNTIYLSNEIWEMSQLRHLHSSKIYLSSPPKVSANEVKYRVLENLQSVYGLSSSCCTKEIFEGIKKVKKLGIFDKNDEYDGKSRCLDNLIYLHELEELSIKSYMSSFVRLPRLDSFPPNLKKLTLNGTGLMWKDMTTISMLPKLNVLQLKNGAFRLTTAWEVTEMGFPELKFLLLEELNLVYWIAAEDYFPCLERVIIRNCRYLREIPRGFTDSVTLQQIELHGCIPSLVTFAEQIQKEQLESSGSDMLKVYAFDRIRDTLIRRSRVEEVMEKVEEDSEEN